MIELNDTYKNFIKDKLYKDGLKAEDITILFNLYNNFVNVMAPEYGKSCGACVKRVLSRTRAFYKDYSLTL